MDRYRLTPLAEADRDGIARYTKREHGNEQCAVYLDALEACFERLAAFPGMGTSADHVRPDLRSWRHGHHVVFYLRQGDGILIVRVLHESMARDEYDFPGGPS